MADAEERPKFDYKPYEPSPPEKPKFQYTPAEGQPDTRPDNAYTKKYYEAASYDGKKLVDNLMNPTTGTGLSSSQLSNVLGEIELYMGMSDVGLIENPTGSAMHENPDALEHASEWVREVVTAARQYAVEGKGLNMGISLSPRIPRNKYKPPAK